MKSSKWVLPALLVVSMCAPLMAQNNDGWEKRLQLQIQLQIKLKQLDHNKVAKCWRCGQKITSASQRCAADCDVCCMPEAATKANPQVTKQNNTPAKTQVEKAKSLGKCWRCGQKITNVSQPCAADCDVCCMPKAATKAKPQVTKQKNTPAKTQAEETKSLGKCWRCGQKITSQAQRCPAECNDVFCEPSQKLEK